MSKDGLRQDRNLAWSKRAQAASFEGTRLEQDATAGNRGLSILCSSGREGRGDGKVTKGITGLWQPSVQSDVAF